MDYLSGPLLQTIFDHLPEPRVIIKPDYPHCTIVAYNRQFAEAAGIASINMRGESLWEAVGRDNESGSFELVSKAIMNVIETRQSAVLPALQYDVSPGASSEMGARWWKGSITPILDQEQNIEYLICTTTNVTEEHERLLELESSRKREQTALAELAGGNQKLASTNYQLTVSNNHLNRVNAELNQSQSELARLNTDLEKRVASRTRELSERENSLRNLVMTAENALMILRGKHWRIEIANPQIATLWGKNLDNIVGKTLMEVLPEIEGQPFPALLRQVQESGIGYRQEEEVFLLSTPEGTIKKYVSFSYMPIKDEDGKVSGIIVSSRDITEIVDARKLLEEHVSKLTTSEARFRHLVHQAPVAIAVLVGLELQVETANEKMLALWGKTQAIIGKPLIIALPELEGQPYLELLNKVYETGEAHYGTESHALLEHEGQLEEQYFNFIYQPTRDYSDQVTGVMVIAIDVTEQVSAKESLAERNQELNQAIKQFEFLANTVPSVVWTAGPDGLLDYINQRWYDRSNLDVKQALGTGWIELVHPDDVARAGQAWSHALSTAEPYEVEFRLMDQKGEYRWYLVRALALKDEQNRVIKWYGTNTDITEHKFLTQQKDDFLAIASHELKTPVTSIKAYAQLLEMRFAGLGDDRNAQLAGKMDKQVTRLTNLIEDLLDVTKINSGKLQFNLSSFDFAHMLNEVIEDVQHTSTTHQIQKKLDFQGHVFADRDRVWQVMVNLLSNAIKYSPGAGEVFVYSELKGGNIQICVQDFGIGISADKSEKVFEQFYRVSDNKDYSFQGLGLGLYISSEIVKRLGGRIWVDPSYPQGSTFCFTLPLKA